jgi:hypothetical protein
MLDKLESPNTAVLQNRSYRFVRLRSAHTSKVITNRLLSTLGGLDREGRSGRRCAGTRSGVTGKPEVNFPIVDDTSTIFHSRRRRWPAYK